MCNIHEMAHIIPAPLIYEVRRTFMAKYSVDKIDRTLGRIVQRFWAVLAFTASMASIVFGAIVFSTSLFAGILLILLGALFIWLGTRAWRDRATLGELLDRDYQSKTKTPSSQNPEG